MRKKKVKGYWVKLSEEFTNGQEAKARAGELRIREHVAHVKVDKVGKKYIVSYSVAKWYLEELSKAGLKL
jgi:hypothetical protein